MQDTDSILLLTVAASKPSDPPHHIMLDRNNMIFCTCRGWRYNGHTCSHLDNFRTWLKTKTKEVQVK